MRILCSLCVYILTLAAPALAAANVQNDVAKIIRPAGEHTGISVIDLTLNKPLFALRANQSFPLASNTKLFTTASLLERWGSSGKLVTGLWGSGAMSSHGVWRGDIYLVGGGDPSFGIRAGGLETFTGASVESLIQQLRARGIRRITGYIYGDNSLFDDRLGVSDSRYLLSPFIGGISALNFRRNLSPRGIFDVEPALKALKRFTRRMERRIPSRGIGGITVTPSQARMLAASLSPPMRGLVDQVNEHSDNFFAEVLLKTLGANVYGKGTTANGVMAVQQTLRQFGSRATMVDGSGLSRSNRATPLEVTGFLDAYRTASSFPAWYRSLPRSGIEGSFQGRDALDGAQGRCRAKTGTLTDVTTLSGYCITHQQHLLAFSILMDKVNVVAARSIQDNVLDRLVQN